MKRRGSNPLFYLKQTIRGGIKMNKKAFVDVEVLASPGFIILAVMAVGATIVGWKMSAGWADGPGWPLWQILIIIVIEVIASYIFAARG
tara:strand:- start:42 stop:308 length:267 start_codon:yes stop_codon:yes gene_type:complete